MSNFVEDIKIRARKLLILLEAALSVAWQCPELFWYALPREARGGYRSPWDKKRRQ